MLSEYQLINVLLSLSYHRYVYAALSAQQKQDFKSCYVWLHDTANIIDFCLRLRSNNGLDVRIQV